MTDRLVEMKSALQLPAADNDPNVDDAYVAGAVSAFVRDHVLSGAWPVTDGLEVLRAVAGPNKRSRLQG